MSLRARIAGIVAGTVAGVLLIVGLTLQSVTAAVLVRAVDDDLRAIAANVERDPRGLIALTAPGRDRLGGAAGIVQLVDEEGAIQRLRGPLASRADAATLPVDAEVLSVVRGEAPSALVTVEVDGVPLRMLVVPLSERATLQVARPIDEVRVVTGRIRRATGLVATAGALLAALAAWRIAGRTIRPVTDLTEAVERVRDGSDLVQRVAPSTGSTGDEVARLARAFDAMLARLDASRLAQERLAADAAHELRTPLTSLRTNVEVLARDVERLAEGDRERLTEDVIGQLDELTIMVDGLVAITRIDSDRGGHVPVDLASLVAEVVASARRRHPQRADDLRIRSSAVGPVSVRGDRRELALACSALIDNAVKYAPEGPIEVVLAAGDSPGRVALTVRDGGPGVAEELLPRLFERFFRAPEARAKPGSGLGLALVERVAHAHEGRVAAASVAPSGLAVTIDLPLAEAPTAAPTAASTAATGGQSA